MRVAALALVLASACAPHQPAELSWEFHARPTRGEVRVLPVLGLHQAPQLRLDGYVGDTVPWRREALRRERTEQLAAVPQQLALYLPGAVNGELGTASEAAFRPGRFPLGGRDRLTSALKGRGDLDVALSSVARGMHGEAVLFTWITGLHGEPLTAEAFPGDIVETEVGPVVVDHAQEPYRVTAGVGMALVSTDGEVVIRYADQFEAVLSGRRGASGVGRDLASALAHEVAMVWPCDPRLHYGEPQQFALR